MHAPAPVREAHLGAPAALQAKAVSGGNEEGAGAGTAEAARVLAPAVIAIRTRATGAIAPLRKAPSERELTIGCSGVQRGLGTRSTEQRTANFSGPALINIFSKLLALPPMTTLNLSKFLAIRKPHPPFDLAFGHTFPSGGHQWPILHWLIQGSRA